jgi:predicted histone-like DNA-binding protein
MAIRIKTQAKVNPRDLEAAPKYFASVISTGKDDTNSLALAVESNTTMSEADIWGVLKALRKVIIERLNMGRTVDLLDICLFKPSVKSEGVENEADFNIGQHVIKVGVNISAKKELQEAVANAGIERA